MYAVAYCTWKKKVLTWLLMAAGMTTHAHTPFEHQADKTLKKLYAQLHTFPHNTTPQRLETISGYFMNTPYVLGALGEGDTARFDQFPCYRTDAFDCETFVTTVLAITLAQDIASFKTCLRTLRYAQGHRDFIFRNHFTDLDFNLNNQNQHILQDITLSFTDKHGNPVAQIATAEINKPAWYQHMKPAQIRLLNPNETLQKKKLLQLQQQGSQLPVEIARIPYIPLSVLFTAQGTPNALVFSKIPHASIIEIIRPNWDLTREIGTHLNVSHLGFAFWKGKELIFRQSSSTAGKVIDVSLVEYLRKARSSPTIKGINIQITAPKSGNNCQ